MKKDEKKVIESIEGVASLNARTLGQLDRFLALWDECEKKAAHFEKIFKNLVEKHDIKQSFETRHYKVTYTPEHNAQVLDTARLKAALGDLVSSYLKEVKRKESYKKTKK